MKKTAAQTTLLPRFIINEFLEQLQPNSVHEKDGAQHSMLEVAAARFNALKDSTEGKRAELGKVAKLATQPSHIDPQKWRDMLNKVGNLDELQKVAASLDTPYKEMEEEWRQFCHNASHIINIQHIKDALIPLAIQTDHRYSAVWHRIALKKAMGFTKLEQKSRIKLTEWINRIQALQNLVSFIDLDHVEDIQDILSKLIEEDKCREIDHIFTTFEKFISTITVEELKKDPNKFRVGVKAIQFMLRIHRERTKNNHTVRQATKNIVNFAIRHMPRSKERDNSIANITCPASISQRQWSNTLTNASDRRFKQLLNVAVDQPGFNSIGEDALSAISNCTNAGIHRRTSSILARQASSIKEREEIYSISRKSGITEDLEEILKDPIPYNIDDTAEALNTIYEKIEDNKPLTDQEITAVITLKNTPELTMDKIAEIMGVDSQKLQAAVYPNQKLAEVLKSIQKKIKNLELETTNKISIPIRLELCKDLQSAVKEYQDGNKTEAYKKLMTFRTSLESDLKRDVFVVSSKNSVLMLYNKVRSAVPDMSLPEIKKKQSRANQMTGVTGHLRYDGADSVKVNRGKKNN